MSSPWFKFYPSDWRADPAVRTCSMAARGLWMEMLCLMHEAEPRGSLLINGQTVTEKKLASLCGISAKELATLIVELEESGVFSRDEAGVIFSRRMRRDEAKAARDKANGGRGGNPKLKAGVNPHDKPDDKAQKPEARSQKESPATPVDPEPAAAAGRGEAVSKSNYDRVESACRAALAEHAPPDPVIGPVAMLEAGGYDLTGEIIPAMLDGAMGSRKPIRTWKLLADKARERIDGDRAAGRIREPARPASTERQIDFGGGFVWPESTVRKAVERWQADPQSWPLAIGPAPGKPGCRVPLDVFNPDQESAHV